MPRASITGHPLAALLISSILSASIALAVAAGPSLQVTARGVVVAILALVLVVLALVAGGPLGAPEPASGRG